MTRTELSSTDRDPAPSRVKAAYLVAAESVARLLADPAVARDWQSQSALAEFTVGGLAAHLAGQVFTVAKVLREPEPTGERVTVLEHYTKVSWIGSGLDSEVNVAIRASGEQSAAAGPAAIAEQVAACVDELQDLLPAEPEERYVSPPAGPWALLLHDFLITRLMEIVVHSDDLAVSVGLDTPEPPEDVLAPVLGLLVSLSLRRHGAAAMIRALSRAERAPASIAAF